MKFEGLLFVGVVFVGGFGRMVVVVVVVTNMFDFDEWLFLACCLF